MGDAVGRIRTLVAVVSLLCTSIAGSASASVITYEATNLGGSGWRYDYTLLNDTSVVPVEQVTIYFDLGVYENLRSATAPTGWDPLTIEPDPALPDDGFYDAIVFNVLDALPFGASLSGFSIDFDFLGAGTPGSQRFQFLLSSSLEVLGDGLTQQAVATAVPEPDSLLLLTAGLFALLALRRRDQRASGG